MKMNKKVMITACKMYLEEGPGKCTLLTIYHNYLEQLPMAPLQAALMALPAPYCDGAIPALLLPRARSPPCSLQYTIHSCSYQDLFYLLALWLSEYLLYYYV